MRYIRAAIKVMFLALRPLSKSADVWGWWDVVQTVAVLAGMGASPFVGGIADAYLSLPNVSLTVALPAVFTGLFFWAGVRLRIRLDTYEQPGIELIFDTAKYAACKMQENVYSPFFIIGDGADERSPIGVRTLYRVGVRVTGRNTVDQVQVMLRHFTPQGAEFLPITLRPMHVTNDSDGTFTLNPGTEPALYVDVVSWTSGETEIQIEYHPQYLAEGRGIPNTIPVGEYQFTLLAHGRHVSPCEKVFVVAFDPQDGLLFYPR